MVIESSRKKSRHIFVTAPYPALGTFFSDTGQSFVGVSQSIDRSVERRRDGLR
jgi:hypothetical protein